MKKKSFLLLCILLSISAFSQDVAILKQGEKAVNQSKLQSLTLAKDNGSFETMQLQGDIIHKATTLVKPEGVYQLGVRIPLESKNISEGQPLLIVFKAKSIQASLETNESKVNWQFRQTESSAPKDVASKSVSLSANWQTYYLPFKAPHSENLDKTTFTLQFGYPPQTFEIKGIELYVFPEKFDYAQLPYTKITYAGMEANAEWRKEAEKRIDEVRKGDFSIQFNLAGKPLSNSKVEIKQIKHHFRFGAAVSADLINKQTDYFETVKKLFNIVVFENDLKAKRWKNTKGQQGVVYAIDLLNANQIKVKGHVLLWPGFQYLPEEYKQNKNNPEIIQKALNDHYLSVLGATKSKISHWDVLNEAYTNKDIPNIFGSNEILFDAFKKAKELEPNAKRFINEYGIISGGGINTTKQDWYYNFIKEIDTKTNGLLDGLGMQSHIGTDLTAPSKVIAILNRFAALNKEISISEYSLDIMDDEELRAKYTRDFMIAAFSNPSVKEFLFWGFYKPMHPKAALVNNNYELTKMGQSYYDLVFNKWMTKLNQTTNEMGTISNRGFFGKYEYTIEIDGKIHTGNFDVLPNSNTKLMIKL